MNVEEGIWLEVADVFTEAVEDFTGGSRDCDGRVVVDQDDIIFALRRVGDYLAEFMEEDDV